MRHDPHVPSKRFCLRSSEKDIELVSERERIHTQLTNELPKRISGKNSACLLLQLHLNTSKEIVKHFKIASKPKRRREVVSISEKSKIINIIEVEKKSSAAVAKIYNKNFQYAKCWRTKRKFEPVFSLRKSYK